MQLDSSSYPKAWLAGQQKSRWKETGHCIIHKERF